MPRDGGLIRRALEEVETRIGYSVTPTTRLDMLEAQSTQLRTTRRELDLLGWSVMDYMSGNPQELTPQARRQWAQQARMVWRQDPQAGAIVDLMNDFVLGRGVPKPRAKDPSVQEVIDEFWEDRDNQLVLTSYEAQLALNTDLTLQCNVFVLCFDGDDGRIKLGLLNHDEVETAVRDPENRLRVLYFMASQRKTKWNFLSDQPELDLTQRPQITYYEHWRNMDDVREARPEDVEALTPPDEKLGEGRVYHIAINRTSEEVFGNPSMRRLIKWLTAYNSYLSSRVDMAQAAAAFIMKRKVKGTPNQVAKLAAKAISRQSELAGVTGTGDSEAQMPPRGGAILSENEQVEHMPMNLNSNAGAAQQDAQMIRSAISAGSRWSQAYLGDQLSTNLATAAAMELPIQKHVENRQEILESLFRWALDRQIEKAVETGRIKQKDARGEGRSTDDDVGPYGPTAIGEHALQEYEGEGVDEDDTGLDLSYEFSMPSPARRMMTDLVSAVTNVAKTFDPNGTNMELNKVLLTIVLGEALEFNDPSDAVERIFPEGYEDPAIVAAREQAQGGAGGEEVVPPTPPGAPDPNNPYSVPGQSSNYMADGGQSSIQQARFDDLVEPARREREHAKDTIDRLLDEELEVAATRLGRRLDGYSVNGNGNGK